MKPPYISLLTVLLLAIAFPLIAQQLEAVTPLSLAQSAYRVGEKLTYNVSFSNFPSAAHVEVEVVSHGNHFGRDAIQLRAHVETTGVVNVALFAINNDYVTYIDPESGLPFRSEETVRDAIKSADSVQDFAQPAGNEAIPPKQKGFPGTFDFVSAFYRARALPLSEGGVYNFSIRGEGGEYQAELKVTGRETIRTNVGSFPTMVTQIKVPNSPFRNLRIYFTDDAGHVPVLLIGRLNAGELRAELAGSELIKPPTETATPTPQLIAAPRPSPTPSGPVPLSRNLPFKLGEELNYQVFIGGTNTPLATASFQVRGHSKYFERDGLFLTVTAQSTGAAARILVIRDQIDSYVDPKSLLPYRTAMNISEGERRLNQILNFNQDTGIVTTDKGTRIEASVGTHDYLSFFYVIRTIMPVPGKKAAISMVVDNKLKTIFIDPLPRESIQLGTQRVQAFPLRLTTDDPEPDKLQLRIWLSDDHQRLPLRITCVTKLGPLRADLAILPTTSQ